MTGLTSAVVISTVIWMLAMAYAAVFIAWELRQTVLDGRFIDERGWNGPMHIVLRRDIKVGLMRLSTAVSYLIFGGLVLAVPGSTLLRIDLTITLLWSAFGILWNSVVDRRSRHFVARAEGHQTDFLPSALRVPHPGDQPPRGPDDRPAGPTTRREHGGRRMEDPHEE